MLYYLTVVNINTVCAAMPSVARVDAVFIKTKHMLDYTRSVPSVRFETNGPGFNLWIQLSGAKTNLMHFSLLTYIYQVYSCCVYDVSGRGYIRPWVYQAVGISGRGYIRYIRPWVYQVYQVVGISGRGYVRYIRPWVYQAVGISGISGRGYISYISGRGYTRPWVYQVYQAVGISGRGYIRPWVYQVYQAVGISAIYEVVGTSGRGHTW